MYIAQIRENASAVPRTVSYACQIKTLPTQLFLCALSKKWSSNVISGSQTVSETTVNVPRRGVKGKCPPPLRCVSTFFYVLRLENNTGHKRSQHPFVNQIEPFSQKWNYTFGEGTALPRARRKGAHPSKVLWPYFVEIISVVYDQGVKTVCHNLYYVGRDVQHCTIQSRALSQGDNSECP